MKRSSLYFFLFGFVAILVSSCGTSNGEFQGREYMPDMAHSIAYEANHYTYYQFNTWGGEEEYRAMVNPGKPVDGTVPFNAAKVDESTRSLTYPTYNFPNTDEGRAAAMAQITSNPIRPANDDELKAVLGKGKELYTIYCASCHGEKGNGNGQLYNEGEGPYPAAPANYLSSAFLEAGDTDGRYYHAIVHGKGVMLSHSDKLNHDERWMVIHYIRELQAKDKGEKYNLEAALASKTDAPKEEETSEEGDADAETTTD